MFSTGGGAELGAFCQPRFKTPSIADVAMHDYLHDPWSISDGSLTGAAAISPPHHIASIWGSFMWS